MADQRNEEFEFMKQAVDVTQPPALSAVADLVLVRRLSGVLTFNPSLKPNS
jgi:hypothetical protein